MLGSIGIVWKSEEVIGGIVNKILENCRLHE